MDDTAKCDGQEPLSQLMLPDGRIFLGRIAQVDGRALVLAEPAYLRGDGQGNASVQPLEKPHANFTGPLRLLYPSNVAVHELDPESDIARAYRAARSGLHLPRGAEVARLVPGLKGTH